MILPVSRTGKTSIIAIEASLDKKKGEHHLSLLLKACGGGGTDTPFNPTNNTGNSSTPDGGDTRAIEGFRDASKLDGDFELSRYFLFALQDQLWITL
jgi:hypothetical protein